MADEACEDEAVSVRVARKAPRTGQRGDTAYNPDQSANKQTYTPATRIKVSLIGPIHIQTRSTSLTVRREAHSQIDSRSRKTPASYEPRRFSLSRRISSREPLVIRSTDRWDIFVIVAFTVSFYESFETRVRVSTHRSTRRCFFLTVLASFRL